MIPLKYRQDLLYVKHIYDLPSTTRSRQTIIRFTKDFLCTQRTSSSLFYIHVIILIQYLVRYSKCKQTKLQAIMSTIKLKKKN